MKVAIEDQNIIQDPPIARFLFSDTRMAIVWLLLRLYVGYEWLEAGWEKMQQAAWMTNGSALQGFWNRAVAVPAPPARAPITFDWYRSFLQTLLDNGTYTWFAKIIAVGEFLVGLGLILGAFVGVAAFFGAFMNFNFMLAGSASTNPMLFFLAIVLMLAWKTAGYIGLDRWLLTYIGTPWQPVPARRLREAPTPTRA